MKLSESDVLNMYVITKLWEKREFVDGIYYSLVTGRVFEANVKNNTVLIRYTDNLLPKSKKIKLVYFLIQKDISLYDEVINYKLEGI